MATSKFLFALLSSALIAVPAMAQTTTAPKAAPTPMTTTAPMPTTGSMPTTASMPAGRIDSSKWMTTDQGDWRASKLKGINVYNNNNEKLGDIEELLMDNTGKIVAVVIGVGGFLGMGEHSVAVPYSDLKFVDRERGSAGRVGTTTTMPATGTMGTSQTNTGAVTASSTYPDRVILDQTKDQLKAAPQFKYRS